MNLTSVSKGIVSVAIFIIVTILLWLLYQQGMLPFIIFIIGFGLTILISVAIWIKPTSEQWQELTVIPIKRKKR